MIGAQAREVVFACRAGRPGDDVIDFAAGGFALAAGEAAGLVALLYDVAQWHGRLVLGASQVQEDAGGAVGEHSPPGPVSGEFSGDVGRDWPASVEVAGFVVPSQEGAGVDDDPHVDLGFEAESEAGERVAFGAAGAGRYDFAFGG